MVSNAWQKDSKGWCYLGSNGAQVKNSWVKDGKYWYYLKADGYMAVNEKTPDGYRVDKKGRWITN